MIKKLLDIVIKVLGEILSDTDIATKNKSIRQAIDLLGFIQSQIK